MRRDNTNTPCNNNEKGHGNLKVGTIVEDRVCPEEVKVIEVPIKQSHSSLNLTDAAFESMGDKVVDSLDTCNEKVITGTEAAQLLKDIQHKNQTEESDKTK